MKKISLVLILVFIYVIKSISGVTETYMVSTSSDDTWEDSDGSIGGLADGQLFCDELNRWCGARWTNINITNNADILDASVGTFNTFGPAIEFTIYFDNRDDAPTFSANTDNISGRPQTGSIVWSDTQADTDFTFSPNVSSILETVINRAGWAKLYQHNREFNSGR